jgi:hypothetical protein
VDQFFLKYTFTNFNLKSRTVDTFFSSTIVLVVLLERHFLNIL